MLSLPPIPPATGWQLPARVADHPFVHFDTNAYSVPPALVGRTVELRADLGHVRVLYRGGPPPSMIASGPGTGSSAIRTNNSNAAKAGPVTSDQRKRPVRLAVIVPAGPGDDVADTLASVIHYTVPSRIVVVVDDTRPATAARAASAARGLTPWSCPRRPVRPVVTAGCGSSWPRYSLDPGPVRPGVILRLDADALVIGAGLESEANARFPGSGRRDARLVPDRPRWRAGVHRGRRACSASRRACAGCSGRSGARAESSPGKPPPSRLRRRGKRSRRRVHSSLRGG